jgi:hypothetical protein
MTEQKEKEDEKENETIIVICQTCKEPVLIEKLNCCIFRHAILIETNQQIDPHSKKEVCDFLFDNKLIYGCGKPFRIEKIGQIYEAFLCDYI